MKKYFSLLCFALLATAAATLISCGDDENDDIIQPGSKPQIQYVSYYAAVSSDFFTYGDVLITMQNGEGSKTYSVSKDGVRRDRISIPTGTGLDSTIISGYTLNIPAVEYKDQKIKYTARFEMSEEGKRKLAATTAGDTIPELALSSNFGFSDARGTIISSRGGKTQIYRGFLEEGFTMLMERNILDAVLGGEI